MFYAKCYSFFFILLIFRHYFLGRAKVSYVEIFLGWIQFYQDLNYFFIVKYFIAVNYTSSAVLLWCINEENPDIWKYFWFPENKICLFIKKISWSSFIFFSIKGKLFHEFQLINIWLFFYSCRIVLLKNFSMKSCKILFK